VLTIDDRPPKDVRPPSGALSAAAADLQTARARLRAVTDLGLELACERDPDLVLHRVCSALRDMFGATFTTIGLLDRTRRLVRRVETCGVDAVAWIGAGDAVPGILATVLAERRAIRGTNPGGDPASLALPLLHPPIPEFLAAPIASATTIHGWICLVGGQEQGFTDHDEQLVMIVAGQFSRIYELADAEEGQRASERRYRALFEYADDGIVIADQDSYYVDANPSICRMLGYSRDELVGLHASDIVDPLEIPQIAPALQEIKTTPHYNREWRFRRKDRSVFIADVRATPMPDGRLLGIIRDVTADNEAAAALRAAEERMRFALEHAHIGIWDMDYKTGALRWSKTLEAHYGLPPGTFAGTFEAFVEHIHPDDRASVIATVAAAAKTGGDFALQNRTLWPDGTIHWLSGAGRILYDEHGEPVRGVGISQDVTERHDTEATLGQSEARKSAILDSVLEAIVTMDANGMVIEFNDAAERTFGYTKANALGRLLADLIVPMRYRAAHTAGVARYLATGAGPMLGKLTEMTAVRSDGVEIPIELTITAIRSTAAPIFTGVMRDITARKLAEDNRKKTEAEVQRLNDEIQRQRLQVFKATIRTVQDIVNNLLNSFHLIRLEGEAHVSAEVLALVDGMIADASGRLKTLGDLEIVTEKQMAIGMGIDYPGAGR
jgi:PAS domain S-box-containing protein